MLLQDSCDLTPGPFRIITENKEDEASLLGAVRATSSNQVAEGGPGAWAAVDTCVLMDVCVLTEKDWPGGAFTGRGHTWRLSTVSEGTW